jgi:hypothetical protein
MIGAEIFWSPLEIDRARMERGRLIVSQRAELPTLLIYG